MVLDCFFLAVFDPLWCGITVRRWEAGCSHFGGQSESARRPDIRTKTLFLVFFGSLVRLGVGVFGQHSTSPQLTPQNNKKTPETDKRRPHKGPFQRTRAFAQRSFECWPKTLTLGRTKLPKNTKNKAFVRISGLPALSYWSPKCEYPASRRRTVMPPQGEGFCLALSWCSDPRPVGTAVDSARHVSAGQKPWSFERVPLRGSFCQFRG